MAPKPTPLTDDLFAYLIAHGSAPDEQQAALIAETEALGDPAGLQISPDEGAFLSLITKLTGAKTAIELGTFTGFSALCIARGLGAEGRMLCCDVSEEWTAIARKHWAAAGVADRIELQIGPALDTLRALPKQPAYDLAFIDADKPSYPAYWEEIVPRVNPGGVILVDNVLFHERVIDDSDQSDGTVAIRELNDRIIADDRVEATMVAIADGVTIARKK
ncbi:MAG: O-methyltransferase [Mycobacteriales bacterium]